MARQNADYQVPPPADHSKRFQRGAVRARVDPPDVEHLARPACKTDTIVKRDSTTLVETVILRLGQIAIGGGRDQPTRSTESNENIRRNHITPAVRDDAHVFPLHSPQQKLLRGSYYNVERRIV